MLDRLKVINETSDKVFKIISSIRAAAHGARGAEFEFIPMENLLEDSLLLIQAKLRNSQVPLEISNYDSQLKICCQPIQISQVIMNLVSNAIDAVEDLREKWIRIDVATDPEYITITITDSGPGIPVDIQDKMMESFFTTKEVGKGTGLGLRISQRIIQEHNGKFYIDNDCSNTRFVIKVPNKAHKRCGQITQHHDINLEES